MQVLKNKLNERLKRCVKIISEMQIKKYFDCSPLHTNAALLGKKNKPKVETDLMFSSTSCYNDISGKVNALGIYKKALP